MLKTPELPTDNLYKFIAIFGLILLVFSIYSFISYQRAFYDRLENSKKKFSENLFEQSKNESKLLILNEKIDYKKRKLEVKYGFSNIYLIDTSFYLRGHFTDEFENDFKELKEFELEKLLLRDYIDNHKRTHEFDEKLNFNLLTPIIVLIGISLFLMFIGFILWYEKLQKYYDKEIVEKVTK